MEKVRVGVIGCGVIGRVHLKCLSKNPSAEIVAVADIREEAAKEAASQFGVTKIYTSPDDLLSDPEVDAVILAFQTAGRTAVALKSFAHGKHVLVEKPVAMNAEEVKQMIASKGDLIAGCCSSRHRFLPSFQVVKSFPRQQRFGENQAHPHPNSQARRRSAQNDATCLEVEARFERRRDFDELGLL